METLLHLTKNGISVEAFLFDFKIYVMILQFLCIDICNIFIMLSCINEG